MLEWPDLHQVQSTYVRKSSLQKISSCRELCQIDQNPREHRKAFVQDWNEQVSLGSRRSPQCNRKPLYCLPTCDVYLALQYEQMQSLGHVRSTAFGISDACANLFQRFSERALLNEELDLQQIDLQHDFGIAKRA